MQLYNSLSQRKEEFTPRENRVTIYVCGITPYDTTHLGHAFTYSVFDVLIRYLEWQNITVRYTQNVTDIDDDILRKAQQAGQDWFALGNEWTAHFIRDMRALNIRPPDDYPRASDVIAEIIKINRQLIERGAAYVSNGSVYFDVDAFEQFGALSHIPRGEMLAVANERGNRPDDPNKQDPLDFVLWQHQAEGEPAWPSPWGEGRPGWHIECTAMAEKFLGEPVDIHGGGGDLIFPHHECEIAQAESASGHSPFVRVWMHVAMVRKDGEKMSKSLGNLVMVDDLLKRYSPDALRLYLASHHYRESWEYNREDLERCAQMAERWRTAASARDGAVGSASPEFDLGPMRRAFQQAMDDDLDTPRAIIALNELATQALASRQPEERHNVQALLRTLGGILGLRLGAAGPEERVDGGWRKHLKKFESKS